MKSEFYRLVLKKHILYMVVATASFLFTCTVSMVLDSSIVQAQEGESYHATFSGKDEVPPNESNAVGWARFVVPSDNASIMSYWVNITGLENITGAHIHNGSAGQNGDIVVALSMEQSAKDKNKPIIQLKGNITKTDLQGLLKGKEISDLVTLMIDGTYVNVHTDKYPNGVIRGQIASGEPQMNASVTSVVGPNSTG